MSNSLETELRATIAAWDRSMVGNNADEIGRYMTDDWVIVGTDGSMDGKQNFLALVQSGDLTHDVMESNDLKIRLYGDTAVTIASGVSGGRYQGQPFLIRERTSCVFVRESGTWLCVHTHLSLMPEKTS